MKTSTLTDNTVPPISDRVEEATSRVHLLGCPIESMTLEETVGKIAKLIQTRRPHQHCVVNAGKMVLMHRDPVLKKIVESCSLINADGQSVVWALRLLGHTIPERVTGIDLMERLFVEANRSRYRVFFLGATHEVLDSVLSHMRRFFPNLVIAGSHHGYFDKRDNDTIVNQIAQSNADILFVAMGSPKKEYWLGENIDKFNVPFCMGVGGSFDVIAGKAKRAPRWIQKVGMEWFYRFIQEPRRLWRRYLVDNFIFIYLVMLEKMGKHPHLQTKKTEELEHQENT